MPDDKDIQDEQDQPLGDRQEVSSKFKDMERYADQVHHGRDLTRENYAPPPGSVNKLEGDSSWERLRPYLVIAGLVAVFLGLLNFALSRAKLFDVSKTLSNPEQTEGASLVSRPSASRGNAAINPAIAIVEDNTMTMGGYERLKRLSALNLRGVVIKDGQETPFSLYARRPNYYRLVYHVNDQQEYIIGYNGDQMWEEFKRLGATVETTLLDENQHVWLRMMADFDLPPQKYVLLSEYTKDRLTPIMEVSLVSRDFIEGDMMEVIRIKEESRPTTLAYIGASSNLLSQTETVYRDEKYRIVYGDYRKIDGVYLPFQREQYVNGERAATIRIDEATFNAGTLLGMFDPPKSMPLAP